ncbi:MAG: hypothetical protein V4722_05475 [Bacteroidota bacterium]
MNFQTMNKQRKFILIAAAVGLISMFLPWISIGMFGSVNGLHGAGFLALFAFAGAGAVAFLGDQTKSLDKTMWFVALACGAIATLIIVINFIRIIGYITPGFGAWLAVAGAVGVLGSAWMFKSPGDDIKSGFDSLKKNISDRSNQPPAPRS